MLRRKSLPLSISPLFIYRLSTGRLAKTVRIQFNATFTPLPLTFVPAQHSIDCWPVLDCYYFAAQPLSDSNLAFGLWRQNRHRLLSGLVSHSEHGSRKSTIALSLYYVNCERFIMKTNSHSSRGTWIALRQLLITSADKKMIGRVHVCTYVKEERKRSPFAALEYRIK